VTTRELIGLLIVALNALVGVNSWHRGRRAGALLSLGIALILIGMVFHMSDAFLVVFTALGMASIITGLVARRKQW